MYKADFPQRYSPLACSIAYLIISHQPTDSDRVIKLRCADEFASTWETSLMNGNNN